VSGRSGRDVWVIAVSQNEQSIRALNVVVVDTPLVASPPLDPDINGRDTLRTLVLASILTVNSCELACPRSFAFVYRPGLYGPSKVNARAALLAF
jgi:hypothetical protein